ncbi:MAG: VOC family protein [Acidobacteria bacterium]|nr:VOC family protein [Acidobacteriota bacterium]MCW5970797.1 VOC family protein [Blastocatellales bacterium]
MKLRSWLFSFCVAFVFCGALVFGSQTPPPAAAPQFPEAHFHHLHLNTLDPAAAIDFYTSKFDAEKARFAGLVDAVWAQKSWLLFTKVNQPPPAGLTSSIWHFGWGAEDMKATYARHLEMGTKFFTPLTDISDIGGNTGARDLFYYAYVLGPDGALIELNTANHHRFGHLHLFSADPVAAGEWYMKYFGARRRSQAPPSRTPRFYRDVQIGPSMSLMMDNVNIIIYPVEYAKKVYADDWKGKTEIESTKGRVVDHVSFSFENLTEALELLRKDGVKVTEEIRSIAGGRVKYAFIEGPDRIRIELIEGHPQK